VQMKLIYGQGFGVDRSDQKYTKENESVFLEMCTKKQSYWIVTLVKKVEEESRINSLG